MDQASALPLPLSERKSRLASLLTKPPNGIKFSDHEGGDGEAFRRAAYRHGLEGLVGWSDPEGTRPFLSSLLLGFHDDDGRLLYAGRVGTGMSQETLALHHRRLKPLKTNQPVEVRRETPGK
jgi:ATP-dependent DNA ligase